MVLMAGKKQVAWPALRKHLGTSRISMATEAEVLQVTGYPLGAVAPFGTLQMVRVLMDKGILGGGGAVNRLRRAVYHRDHPAGGPSVCFGRS